jgi:hypothetical protein
MPTSPLARFGVLVTVLGLSVFLAYVQEFEVWKNAERIEFFELPSFAGNPYTDTTLKDKATKFAENKGLEGPETVIFSPNDNVMFTFTRLGKVCTITEDGDVNVYVDLNDHFQSGTRPLGAAFAIEGVQEVEPGDEQQQQQQVLYIADAVQGLIRIDQDRNVKLVSTAAPAGGRRIRYANDVDVGKVTGDVYFTDSTDIAPQPVQESREKEGGPALYDTLGASITDVLRARRMGRLLKYSPRTGKTVEVVDDMWFANGVTLAHDESHALVCETFSARVLKVPLQLADHHPVQWSASYLPGYCDGINYSADGKRVYVSVPSPPPMISRVLPLLPAWLSQALRCFVLAVPPSLRPGPVKAGIVLVLDGASGETLHTFTDPTGETISMVSSITEDPRDESRLLLGTLSGNFVGVLKL